MRKHDRADHLASAASGIWVHTAPKPVSHIKGGRYSLDLAIDVAIDKYINHVPLDRQRRMMGRAGLVIVFV